MSCCCSAATGKDGVSGKCAKIIHVVMLGIACIVALILRYNGEGLNIDLYAWKLHCDGGDGAQQDSNTYYAYCQGDAAVYRISFVLTLFYLCTLLGSLCSSSVHRGWWGPKLFAFFALLIGSVWIPNYVFDNSGYAWIARVCSTLFLLLQILILIDFGYQWNEDWVSRAYAGAASEYDDATDKKWLAGVLSSAAVLYILAIVGVSLLFSYYSGCSLGTGTTAFTLIATCVVTALSLFRDKIVGVEGAILPAAVVTAYAVYLNWSALESNPDAECKPEKAKDGATITIGILVAAVSLMWTSYSASRNASGLLKGQNAEEVAEEAADKPFYRVDDGKDGKDGDDAEAQRAAAPPSDIEEADAKAKSEAEDAKESYWFFHLIMMTASMYMAMLLTNWGAGEVLDSGEEYATNYGNTSMWVKIVSEWLTLLLYVWTLLAPRLMAGRDFS